MRFYFLIPYYRYTADELRQMLEESDCEYEDSYVASDDDNYIPSANFGTSTTEDLDIELEVIIEQEEEYSSAESVENEPVSHKTNSISIVKDETEWNSNPLPSAKTISDNILHQKVNLQQL